MGKSNPSVLFDDLYDLIEYFSPEDFFSLSAIVQGVIKHQPFTVFPQPAIILQKS